MLAAIVHAADIQDRDGGAMLMATLFGLYPFLLKLYADSGYQGPLFQKAMKAIMVRWKWKSSSVRIRSKGSSCCPNAGWSSEHLLGSTGAAASPRIGNASTGRHAHTCCSRPSG